MDLTPRADMAKVRNYVAVVGISSLRIGPVKLGKLSTNDNYSSKMQNWRRLKPLKFYPLNHLD